MEKKDDLKEIKDKKELELLKLALSIAEDIADINFEDIMQNNQEVINELSRDELARELHFQGVRYILTLMALSRCDKKTLDEIKRLAKNIDDKKKAD